MGLWHLRRNLDGSGHTRGARHADRDIGADHRVSQTGSGSGGSVMSEHVFPPGEDNSGMPFCAGCGCCSLWAVGSPECNGALDEPEPVDAPREMELA